MIELDAGAANVNSRLALVILNASTMRQMEHWRYAIATVIGRIPDCDDVMIVGAVLSIGSEKLLRANLATELRNMDNVLPYDRLTACSVASIAATTDINRETVRRRVARMISDGLLVRDNGSVRLAPGILQLPVARDVVHRQLGSLQMTVERLCRLGIIRL